MRSTIDWRLILASLAAMCLLAGCAQLQAAEDVLAQAGVRIAASATPVPTACTLRSPVDPALIPYRYTCDGRLTFHAADLAGPPIDVSTLGTLDGMAQEELANVRPGSGWRLVAQTPTERFLVQVVSATTTNYLRLMLQDRASAPGGSIWTYANSGDCEPRAVLRTGLGGYLRQDRAFPPPVPESRSIRLLVAYMRLCPSAVDITGRARVALTPDAALILVPVRAAVNTDMCIVGPSTPLTVRLPKRLGDRTLYDASTLPLRPIRRR